MPGCGRRACAVARASLGMMGYRLACAAAEDVGRSKYANVSASLAEGSESLGGLTAAYQEVAFGIVAEPIRYRICQIVLQLVTIASPCCAEVPPRTSASTSVPATVQVCEWLRCNPRLPNTLVYA